MPTEKGRLNQWAYFDYFLYCFFSSGTANGGGGAYALCWIRHCLTEFDSFTVAKFGTRCPAHEYDTPPSVSCRIQQCAGKHAFFFIQDKILGAPPLPPPPPAPASGAYMAVFMRWAGRSIYFAAVKDAVFIVLAFTGSCTSYVLVHLNLHDNHSFS